MSDDKLDQAERFPRRTLRRQNTRARILRAAMELFRKVGYSAATMNAIADAADVHVTTLFVHFKSKQDLAVSINDASIELLERYVHDAKGKVPFFSFFRKIVLSTAKAIKADDDSDPELSLWHELKKDPELTLAWVNYEQRQIALFADYIADDYGLDVASDYAPSLIASLLVSSSWLSHRRWSEDPKHFDLTQETEKALKASEAMAMAVLKAKSGRRSAR